MQFEANVPTFEDKVLQRAAMMALEPVYEQDFLDSSYGFRRGRSQHMALDSLRAGLMEMEGGYVIDLDIRRYFDEIDHRLIQQILRQRIRDGVLRRLSCTTLFRIPILFAATERA